jgi:hypothetical protein
MGVKRLMGKLVGIFTVSSVYSDYLFKVYLSAKCSFMPRKLAWHLVRVKHNSMEGGVHFNSLFLNFKNAISEEKCMYAHRGEAFHAVGIPTA